MMGRVTAATLRGEAGFDVAVTDIEAYGADRTHRVREESIFLALGLASASQLKSARLQPLRPLLSEIYATGAYIPSPNRDRPVTPRAC